MCRPWISRGRYRPVLDALETERAIKLIKDFFENNLARALRLRRVTAPLFVRAGTGINDDLNGIEKPVSFAAPETGRGAGRDRPVAGQVEAPRPPLPGIEPGDGIYTDMNAVRPDEVLDQHIRSTSINGIGKRSSGPRTGTWRRSSARCARSTRPCGARNPSCGAISPGSGRCSRRRSRSSIPGSSRKDTRA